MPQTDDSEPLGKYGRMRLAYLKTQRPVLYNKMLLNDTLWPHLQDVQKNGLQVAGTHDDHSIRQVPRAGQRARTASLGGAHERAESAGGGGGGEGSRVSMIFLVYPYEHGIMEQRSVIP